MGVGKGSGDVIRKEKKDKEETRKMAKTNKVLHIFLDLK